MTGINHGKVSPIWKKRMSELSNTPYRKGVYKSFPTKRADPTASPMQFINILNAIIADAQLVIRQQSERQRKTETDLFFDVGQIELLYEAVNRLQSDVETDEERDELDDIVSYLDDMSEAVDKGEHPQEDQYLALYYMTQQFRQAYPQFAKYTANMQAPDVLYDWDSELLPENVSSSYSLRSLGALSYYKEAHQRERSMRTATKHNLSFGQVHDAYARAREVITSSGNGWVMIFPFSGLNRVQIGALVEEGLIKVSGNQMTLTRLGWEKPQWYKY